MKNIIKNIETDILNLQQSGIYTETGYFMDPNLMRSLLVKESTLNLSNIAIYNFIQNAQVVLTNEEIKHHIAKLSRTSPNPSKHRNINVFNQFDTTPQIRQLIKILTHSSRKYDEYTLEYFQKYIAIIQHKCLVLYDLINEIMIQRQKISMNIKVENPHLLEQLKKYDITINEYGSIYQDDIPRLIIPFISNLITLNEKLNRANDLKTYETFTLSKEDLKLANLQEADIFPSKELQIYSLEDPLPGNIPLSNRQKKSIEEQPIKLKYTLHNNKPI